MIHIRSKHRMAFLTSIRQSKHLKHVFQYKRKLTNSFNTNVNNIQNNLFHKMVRGSEKTIKMSDAPYDQTKVRY